MGECVSEEGVSINDGRKCIRLRDKTERKDWKTLKKLYERQKNEAIGDCTA